jgi:RNA polymerase sigma factor (sigma-70 family)
MASARTDSVVRQLGRAVFRPEDSGPTDGQLLAAFIDCQDEEAFAALVRRHGPMVLGVCRRVICHSHDAEDAFQAAFLVLARRAAAVRPRERVGPWLYGVAYRTALKARAVAGRRRSHERQVTDMPEPEADNPDPWPELQPILDRELNGLPESYRLAIVLCDLEGRTIAAAARQLGLPQGTLAGRLNRGRRLLARRLASRGIVVSAGSLAVIVSQHTAAAVSASLVKSTARAAAAIATAAGRMVAVGTVPAKVANLTNGVLRTMLLNKLKSVTVRVLFVALLAGAAGAIFQSRAADPPKDGPKDKPASVPALADGRTPRAAGGREYVLTSRVVTARADQPDEVLLAPRLIFEEGQRGWVQVADEPENLLQQVIHDEKIRTGTVLDVRVNRLGAKKVRLVLSFEQNAVEAVGVDEIRVLGQTVQAVHVVELHKPVKIVFEKDARGTARRWVEITVDEVPGTGEPVPAATAAEPRPKAAK